MHTAAIVDAAGRLGRIPPCAETVLALAEIAAGRASTSLRSILLRDPGALLSYLKLTAADSPDPPDSLFHAKETGTELASRLLQDLGSADAAGFADWNRVGAVTVYRLCRTVAETAERLADAKNAPVDTAAVTGLLCALGPLTWYSRSEPTHRNGAAAESAALTRHLVRRLELPEWLGKVLLSLDLSVELAAALGADRQLLLIVQAAAGLARQRVGGTNGTASAVALRLGHPPGEALRELDIAISEASDWADSAWSESEPPKPAGESHLVWRALRLSQASRPAEERSRVEQLEAETEKLRQLLAWLHETEETRLRDAKLRGLAELAAGAAHEVNTPLAVISGQAQHLLRSEENVERAGALQRIVAQAHRIHEMFKNLMLYARPPAQKRKQLRLDRLVRSVVEQFTATALARNVALELAAPPALRCSGDPALLRVAMGCLVRNALEAAPAGGWVRVQVQVDAGTAAIVVEDNGPGLTAAQREHLFDPFYSGRSAGRGLGLGLPKAWRIAQLHGGEITFACTPNQPTRFTLTRPGSPTRSKSVRKTKARTGTGRKKRRR